MFEWTENNTITITPPAKPKKLTGTRFAAVLNRSAWDTPFSIWCAVTRTYEEPFEETKYTAAGKTIEPKQLAYCKNVYFMRVHTPTDEYGANFFEKTWGDFFPETPIFGGMWDSLVVNKDGKPIKVIECKTTKRAEDWEGESIPEHYALQAALYAYLIGVDDVIMVASFLEESDYDHPEKYVPSVKNTILRSFKVSERYPKFKQMIAEAEKWWKAHVEKGISPAYDEKRDAEILKILRTKVVDTSKVGNADIIAEIEALTDEIGAHEQVVADKVKRLKTLKETLSKQMQKAFVPGDKSVKIDGRKYVFIVTKSMTEGVDKEALKADGIYEKYIKYTEKCTLTVKVKEDK